MKTFETKEQRLNAKKQIIEAIEAMKEQKKLWRFFRKTSNFHPYPKDGKFIPAHRGAIDGKQVYIPDKWIDNDGREWTYKDEVETRRMQYNFRHLHIAYCMLLGTTLDKIEKPRDGNEPSNFLIHKCIAQLLGEQYP